MASANKVADRLALSASLVLLARVAGAILQIALVAVIALFYSVEDVGLNGLLWAVAVVFRTAGTFGLDVAGMKLQAPLWQLGETESARVYARRDTRVLVRG